MRVKGRLVACKAIHSSAEPNSLMVRIDNESRKMLLASDPGTYYLTDHYAPYTAILVRLSKVGRTALRGLLAQACEFVSGGARA